MSDRRPPPVWTPTAESVAASNLGWLMRHVGVDSYDALHAWSVRDREAYWRAAVDRLGVRFREPPDRVLDPSPGAPRWLPGARLDLVESCLAGPADAPAVVHQAEGGPLRVTTVGELGALVDRVAAGLVRRGCRPGTAVGIVMPMTAEAVAVYLGILKAGCVAVGVAESFRPREIGLRLRLAGVAVVFTQDVTARGGKTSPLYTHVVEANAAPAVVLPATSDVRLSLHPGDSAWAEFLPPAGPFGAVPLGPDDPVTVLFSSGTTGEPKAIPWTATTPLKCAADAHFHQDVRPGGVVVWPTSLGWMMGPWLIFAALLNRAAVGLFVGSPAGRPFGEFVRDAGATMLGVVPTLVKTWRTSGCMDGLDWSNIAVFSSTGECSAADDMWWLSNRAGGRPIIEYCGGTEVGGGYLTGTVARPCVPGTFNAVALGVDLDIRDEGGRPADVGEAFLVPPSVGLSETLLNADHHAVYFTGTPTGDDGRPLRRHGDRVERLPDGYWRVLGRADDAMNLGGIKVGSAEIERVLQAVPGVVEVAAVGVAPGGGPSRLVVFAVMASDAGDDVAAAMRDAVRRELNPLFKIHDVVSVAALPRTASNKVLRRELRDRYLAPLGGGSP